VATRAGGRGGGGRRGEEWRRVGDPAGARTGGRLGPAPRLLWSLDRRGWVALVFEDVDGAHPTLPPGLPTLRAFRLGQGVVALGWLRRRTGWA
jgi:hypothetical protein